MKSQDLITTARALVADDKELLAMDEGTPTCHRRFAAQGIPPTVAARRAYRELIITAVPGVVESISGAIRYDERKQTRHRDFPGCSGEQAAVEPNTGGSAGQADNTDIP